MKNKNKQKCSLCTFAHVNLKLNMFSCRRFPPATIPVTTKEGTINLHTQYPLLKEDDPGCAEFISRIKIVH